MSESNAMAHGELDAIRTRHRHRNAGNSGMLAFLVCAPADTGALLAENGRLRKEVKAGRRRLEKSIAKNGDCESCPGETGLRASPNMTAECGLLLKRERDAAVADLKAFAPCSLCRYHETTRGIPCSLSYEKAGDGNGNGAGYGEAAE